MSNKPISGASFAFREELDERQIADLDIGLAVCRAFWSAAQALPSYEIEVLRPHGRCIYASLAVRDILWQLGRNNAVVQKVGLDVRRYTPDMRTILNGIRVGTDNYKSLTTERRWNAHLVVKLGDVFIDPTIAQVRREWNNMPHYSAMVNIAPADNEIQIDGKVAKTIAVWMQKKMDSFIQISYFELPRELDVKTRGYLKAPDAKPEARIDVVREALNILSNATSATSENAI